MRMTYDHTIDDPGEYKRIIKEGGFISNGGLCGALKLSRCFGNWSVKNQGLIVNPYITKIEINNDDLYLIIASDGIWDVIKDEEISLFIEKNEETNNICKGLI
jgi:serine/threonine protein phosphatase PrpC